MASKPKLLVVDDDNYIQELLYDVLCQDYSLDKAEDGNTAIEMIDDNNFDLILLDVMMPHKNGFQVAQHMINSKNNTPFIFLTAKYTTNDRVEGLELGAEDYISKPFFINELKLKIQKKLDNQMKINLRDKRLQLVHHNTVTPIGVIYGTIQLQTQLLNVMKSICNQTTTDNDFYLIDKTSMNNINQEMTESIQWMNHAIQEIINNSKNITNLYNQKKIFILKEKISLDIFIHQMITNNSPKKLNHHIQEPIPQVLIAVDIKIMNSVFHEILDNCILHNNNSNPFVSIKAQIYFDYLIISFLDNGIGINDEDFEHVFQEFWTGYEELNHTRGQGLGLFLCKKYINAHNGLIWIEQSHKSFGTNICFSLPILKDTNSE